VILDLDSAQAVREAVGTLARRLTGRGSRLEGVLLQRYVKRGLEALVGVTTDPSAREMLDGLRARRLLDGFRGEPPADREALLSVILRVSALVELMPELAELDLNPIKVLPPGQGAIVVDARLRVVSTVPVEKSGS
jgi:acetyltransferase